MHAYYLEMEEYFYSFLKKNSFLDFLVTFLYNAVISFKKYANPLHVYLK
jgi:hypothetical protein